MSGPWERYQQPQSERGKPWERYQPQTPEPPEMEAAQLAQRQHPRRNPTQEAPRPSLFRMDSDFRERSNVGPLQMLVGAARDTFGSHESAAGYLAKLSGGSVEQSPEGPLVRLLGGERYRVNDPGLDTTDVGSFASNVGAFLIPAGWMARANQARNIGRAGQVVSQGATAGATDAALQLTFNDGKVDPVRTGLATAGGSAGEALAPVIGRFIERGAQFAVKMLKGGANRLDSARAFASSMGVTNPSQQELARLADALEEVSAGADPRAVLGHEQFGFLYTQAQRAADPVRRSDLWAQEEYLRQQPGVSGLFAQLDELNGAQRQAAVRDTATRLGAQPGATPAELMTTVQGRTASAADELRGRVSDAYEAAGQSERAAVGVGAVQQLPDRLRGAVRDFDVTPQLTPAAARTLEQLRAAGASLPEGTMGVTLRAIETQRRIINNNIGAAANPTDRAAMRALKGEFDAWLDDAVESALISGDDAALAALKDARGLRAEFGRRFEGREQVDKFVRDLLEDGTRTPEELLNIALGAGQISKDSGGRFVERLRVAVANDPAVLGALRAAHFLKMTTGANGDVLGPRAITQNIARMEFQNQSAIRALYSLDEWRQVKQLAAALEPMLPPDNFARTSGSGERVARMLAQRAAGKAPVIGWIARGVENVRTALRANRAIHAPLRPDAKPMPAATTVFPPALSEYERRRAGY